MNNKLIANKNLIKFILLSFIFQSCNLGSGTHGFIKSYEFPISKYKLENGVDSVMKKNKNIQPDNKIGFYNDAENYLTFVINKDSFSFEYTIRYLGDKTDWDISSKSEIFICYIFDEKGTSGGSVGDEKFMETPVKMRADMINIFESEFVNKIDRELNVKHDNIDGVN